MLVSHTTQMAIITPEPGFKTAFHPKEIFTRITNCLKRALNWLLQNIDRCSLAVGLSGLAVFLLKGDSLFLLPLSIINLFNGISGLVDRHCMKAKLKREEGRLESIQAAYETLKQQLPKSDQPLDSIDSINSFANNSYTAAQAFTEALIKQKAVDSQSLKLLLETMKVNLDVFPKELQKLKDDELKGMTRDYRLAALLDHERFQKRAEASVAQQQKYLGHLREQAKPPIYLK